MKYMTPLPLLLFFCAAVFAQQAWPLQNGVQTEGIVETLEYDSLNNLLYAGGYFSAVNGVKANNVAVWNDTSWQALGSGLPWPVYSMKKAGGSLYAFYVYATNDYSQIYGIARWDGSSWKNLGEPFSSEDYPPILLAYYDNYIWTARPATGDDGLVVNKLAFWDSTNWQFPLIPINLNFPQVLKVLSGKLYLLGSTSLAPSGTNADIAEVYDGTSWSTLPYDTDGAFIADADLTNGDLIISTSAGVQQLENGTWQTICSEYIGEFYNYNDSIWVIQKDNDGNQHFYAFNGNCYSVTSFGSFFSGYYAGIFAAISGGGQLYVAGDFWSANGSFCSSFYAFNGNKWTIPGYIESSGEVTSYNHPAEVSSMLYDSSTGQLIVGGYFYFAGDSLSPYIAMWDGSNWHTMGAGFNGQVTKLRKYNGIIYAAGNFTYSGITPVNYIAQWNGTGWVPSGSGANAPVMDMIVLNNNLYIGGFFTSVNGVKAYGIASFNGSQWSAVGKNVTAQGDWVTVLSSYNGNLVAGTKFGFDGDTMINGSTIIRLIDSVWHGMGNNDELVPLSFLELDSQYYVAANDSVYKWTDGIWQGCVALTDPEVTNQAFLFALGDSLILSENQGVTSLISANTNTYLNNLFIDDIEQIDNTDYYIGGTFPYLYSPPDNYILNNIATIKIAPPSLTLSVDSSTICNNQTVSFYPLANDLSAFYQWYFPGGSPDTSTQVNPDIQYSQKGTYMAYAICSNLFGTDTVYLAQPITVDSCLSITNNVENISIAGVSIYPNPTAGNIYVQSLNNLLNRVC